MAYVLFGLAALIGTMLAAHALIAAQPAVLAYRLRVTLGAVCLGLALVVAARGGSGYAFALVPTGLWLLSGAYSPWSGTGGPAPGRASRIVTDHLDMELDHDTGAVRGMVRTGFFAGRAIESLRPVELAHLWTDCRFSDPASAQVVEAYLDRVHPSWRDDLARTGGADTSEASVEGTMTRAAALDILGLGPDATEADIRRAHRELILKVHPDSGGSHVLAATVNRAKQVLLGR